MTFALTDGQSTPAAMAPLDIYQQTWSFINNRILSTTSQFSIFKVAHFATAGAGVGEVKPDAERLSVEITGGWLTLQQGC